MSSHSPGDRNPSAHERYLCRVTTAHTPDSTKQNLLNLTPADAGARLRDFFARIDQPAYRAAQVVRRLWVNPAPDFAAMTELPAALREQLAASFEIPRLEVAARQKSADST